MVLKSFWVLYFKFCTSIPMFISNVWSRVTQLGDGNGVIKCGLIMFNVIDLFVCCEHMKYICRLSIVRLTIQTGGSLQTCKF